MLDFLSFFDGFARFVTGLFALVHDLRTNPEGYAKAAWVILGVVCALGALAYVTKSITTSLRSTNQPAPQVAR